MHYTLLCFLLLSLISISFCFELPFNKRQAIASRSCGEQNNTVGICSPTSTSIWTNNTDQEITWKWNNPKFDQYTELDLYLLYQNDSLLLSNDTNTTNYQTIKSWLGQDKSKGILVQHIDDSWYPTSPLAPNSANETWIMYMYIVGANYPIQSDLSLIPQGLNFFPVPQSFSLIQSALNTSSSSSPTTSSPSSTVTTNATPSNASVSSNNNNTNNNMKLPGWAIAVIVIASLLFILASAALIWAFKRYQNRKQLPPNHTEDEKMPVLTPAKNESTIQIMTTPTTPTSNQQQLLPTSVLVGEAAATATTAATRSIPPPQQNQLGLLNSEANQSSSILSSTDALMIADTFRQFMRKPDWNEELELNEKRKAAAAAAAAAAASNTIKD